MEEVKKITVIEKENLSEMEKRMSNESAGTRKNR